jgi:hypothetical protein
MSTDPWQHADAAYALGGLEPAERAAYEEHLLGCAACRAQVAAARAAVGLLAGGVVDAPPLPDTLLPSLLREARRARRRRLVVTSALVGVAASLLTVLVTAVPLSDLPDRVPMAAVGQVPISAEAAVEPTAWGTRITLTCRYAGAAAPGYRYELRVRATDGTTATLGSWELDGRSATFTGGTALPVAQIAAVEVTDSAGTTVLTLPEPGARA